MEKAKVSDESVDEVTAALLAFFKREGEGNVNKGYKAVAQKMGLNPQQLYYIVSGRNDPTLKVVMAVLRSYPDEVELRRALSLPVGTLSLAKAPDTATADLLRLESDYNRKKVEYLEREVERLWRLALPDARTQDAELSFLAVSSQAPYDMTEHPRIGFQIPQPKPVAVRLLKPVGTYPVRLRRP